MSYIDEVKERIMQKNPNEPLYHQAIGEILDSLRLAIDKHEDEYRKTKLLERLLEPERSISFRVTWVDDKGEVQVNRGYRIQFNSAIGPYKGGLRFHPTVNRSMLNFLALEQTFKNALTGQAIGGAKGGSDFDPKGKSDGEVMRFCQSFMNELYRHIGPSTDVPAGDIGVGAREIGYLYGQYKHLKNMVDGTISGKGIAYGGSEARTEATGYGLVYIASEALASVGKSFEGATVVVSGSGNVATYAVEKAQQLGATVVTVSDTSGYVYDPNGIDVAMLKQIKEVERARISVYADRIPTATFYPGENVWGVKCDIALPCAIQNELALTDAEKLVKNGCIGVFEGANMPTTREATAYLQKNGIIFIPGKASNAGGVAVSALEMGQNASRKHRSFADVDTELKEIMHNIYTEISQAAADYNVPGNFVVGANIAGFRKVIKAMREEGCI